MFVEGDRIDSGYVLHRCVQCYLLLQVLAEYAAQGYIAATEEKLWAKYVKKITKSPLFKVVKERVKLSA